MLRILLILAVSYGSVHASPDVIYGTDDRVEVFEGTELQQKLAASVATLIENDKIKGGQIQQTSLDEILGGKLTNKSRTPFCADERFVSQPSSGKCSGFLIGPDLILTAGHCVQLEKFCENYKWVFDFKLDPATLRAGENVLPENVYSCKSVISKTLNMNLMLDYGLVQLDRVVSGREPLQFRTKGKVRDQASLFLIGNPVGVPLKVIGGGAVRDNSHPFFFSANLDSFEGNSGGAVFDADTGLVEGILVRGEQDFRMNKEKKCREANRCTDGGCQGEDSTRVTAIPEIGLYEVFHKAVLNEDLSKLEMVTKQNFWIDFYIADGKSALIKASEKGLVASIEFLVSKKANPGLKDGDGFNSLHHFARVLNKKNGSALKSLLSAGLESQTPNQDTPLLLAAKAMNLEGVKLLLEAGANPLAVNAQGDSILNHIIQSHLDFSCSTLGICLNSKPH